MFNRVDLLSALRALAAVVAPTASAATRNGCGTNPSAKSKTTYDRGAIFRQPLDPARRSPATKPYLPTYSSKIIVAFVVLLAVYFVPAAYADEEQHDFMLCNHLSYDIYAAVAEPEPRPSGTVVRGWYSAKAGLCAHIPISHDHFYIHVRGRVGNQVRVSIPGAYQGDDFNISYCFDPDSRFEFHGTDTACPNGTQEVFYYWAFFERGERWDVR